MPFLDIIWDFEPDGNVEHIAEHDLVPSEVDDVLRSPGARDTSRSTGLPMVFGFTADGRYIVVIYEQVDATTVFPVTAYEVEV